MSPRSMFLIGICAVLLLAACGPEPGMVGPGHECEDYKLTPVLFVHGSGLSSSSWTNAIRILSDLGYPPSHLLAINLLPSNGDNIRAAEEQISPAVSGLLEAVAAKYERSGCTGFAPSKVALVAHSMGAMSSRWYAARISPEKVRLFISIAGSNHGSDALCGLEGAGNRQMCPAYSDDSRPGEIQEELNGTRMRRVDETPYGPADDSDPSVSVTSTGGRNILYVTIRIDPDEWIKPSESAELDGSGDGLIDSVHSPLFEETSPGNFLLRKSVDHDYLPKDPDVVNFIGLILRQSYK